MNVSKSSSIDWPKSRTHGFPQLGRSLRVWMTNCKRSYMELIPRILVMLGSSWIRNSQIRTSRQQIEVLDSKSAPAYLRRQLSSSLPRVVSKVRSPPSPIITKCLRRGGQRALNPFVKSLSNQIFSIYKTTHLNVHTQHFFIAYIRVNTWLQGRQFERARNF